jgi:hypothetical protein
MLISTLKFLLNFFATVHNQVELIKRNRFFNLVMNLDFVNKLFYPELFLANYERIIKLCPDEFVMITCTIIRTSYVRICAIWIWHLCCQTIKEGKKTFILSCKWSKAFCLVYVLRQEVYNVFILISWWQHYSKLYHHTYSVFHVFLLTKWDDYLCVIFDHFCSELHFFYAEAKICLNLKRNHHYI